MTDRAVRIEEKIGDLPEKIRAEMSYRERRQRMLDQASLGQRIKWKVTGVPIDSHDDDKTWIAIGYEVSGRL